jgi:hypothetical protein
MAFMTASAIAGWVTDASTWVGGPLMALLRHPLLVMAVVLLAMTLLTGAGRALGAPMLFWHESRRVQRAAGFACTALVAYLLLSVAMAERTEPGPPVWVRLAAFGAVFWGAVVVTGAWLRVAALRARARGAPRTRWALTPPLRTVRGDRLLPGDPLEVSPAGFVEGTLAAAFLLAGLAYAAVKSGHVIEAGTHTLAQSVGLPPWKDLPHVLAALALVGLPLLALATLGQWATPPAVGLCVLIALAAAVDCTLTYALGGSGVVGLLMVAVMIHAGRERYAIRVPELDDDYPPPARPAARRDSAAPSPPATPPATTPTAQPLSLADALIAPAPVATGWPDDGEGTIRPLILICTSGGGIRAAVWTAFILEKLEKRVPRFAPRTLMITGASGGMVGAAAWLAALHREQEASDSRLRGRDVADLVDADALSPTARAMVFRDVPRAFRAAFNAGDRGRALQAAWTERLQREFGVDFGMRLSELAAKERNRELPSLVFSPTVVEDGSRVFISNLHLDALTRAEAPWLATRPGEGPGRSLASTGARHLRNVIGPERAERVTLATAARLSASFPFVSPAVVLPSVPRRRLVDAGYTDNFGVDIATRWLREALTHQTPWLYQHVSKIVVIQIRDSHLYVDEPDNEEPDADLETWGARFTRAAEGISSPLECLLRARDATMRFRNDAQLDIVSQLYANVFGTNFLTTTVFELRSHVSLSWYLSTLERSQIREQAASRMVDLKAEDVGRWLRCA